MKIVDYLKSLTTRKSEVDRLAERQNSILAGYSTLTPYIMKESNNNMSQLDVFSELMSRRIIFFGEEVTSETCNLVNCQLLWMNSVDKESPITIYINTPGGEVYSGLSVFDTIKHIGQDCTINTICCGLAASMGSILMCSGTRGHRYALPHSRIMIHQPISGTGRAQATDIQIVAEETNKLKEELLTILSDTSGKKYKDVYEDCERDHWLKAEECLPGKYGKYGLIDEIIK